MNNLINKASFIMFLFTIKLNLKLFFINLLFFKFKFQSLNIYFNKN